ncbi:MAG: polysulfide reductase NrfD [Actinobacteria bacterium]|nr:polysulfide reductase NrfD [Actinomycetota bacterium]
MNLPLLGNGLEKPWELLLIIDLFLGGVGVGAFLAAVCASVHSDKYKTISKIGAIIAPLAVIGGLISLLAELNQPFRFYTTYFRLNPTSVLSWGVWIQTIFIIVALLYAILWIMDSNESTRKALGYIGAIFAFIIAIYHGLFLSAASARDLWESALTPVIFLVSAITTGLAVVLLIASFLSKSGEVKEGIAGISKHLAGFVGLELILVLLNAVVLLNASVGARDVMRTLVIGDFSFMFWIGIIIIGLLIPLVIELFGIYLIQDGGAATTTFIPLIVSVLVLVGGFLLRYLIVTAGQTPPLL